MICPIMNAGTITRKEIIDNKHINYAKYLIICEKNNCALWIGTYEDGMCAITKIALKE